MHPRVDVPEALLRLIHAQEGALTREQALALGLPRRAVQRLVEQGQWSRLGSGVYSVGVLRPSWLTLAWAGVLLGGDAACLARSAAGYLHGLVGRPPSTIDVYVPEWKRVPVAGEPWRFTRTRRLGRLVGTPPRTPIEDTVLDLCDDADLPLERVVGLVTDAVQQRRTEASRLLRALDGRARHPRRRELQELLGEVKQGVRSPLERYYLRDVERAHGLPGVGRQVRRRGTEADLLYLQFALLVELDGRIGHEGSGRFRDMRRDNAALAQDQLATLRYGYHDVRGDPCAVAAEVASVLHTRGWTGAPNRCTSCANRM